MPENPEFERALSKVFEATELRAVLLLLHQDAQTWTTSHPDAFVPPVGALVGEIAARERIAPCEVSKWLDEQTASAWPPQRWKLVPAGVDAGEPRPVIKYEYPAAVSIVEAPDGERPTEEAIVKTLSLLSGVSRDGGVKLEIKLRSLIPDHAERVVEGG